MRLQNPKSCHKEDLLPALSLAVTEEAAVLLVGSRVQFFRFINRRASVTPELALRLAKWIPAHAAIMWLQMQADCYSWQAECGMGVNYGESSHATNFGPRVFGSLDSTDL